MRAQNVVLKEQGTLNLSFSVNDRELASTRIPVALATQEENVPAPTGQTGE